LPEISGSRVLLVGGAGFIGSHVAERLLDEGVARVTVLDNFVRGSRANLERAAEDDRLEIVEGSVLDRDLLAALMADADYVHHLAALWLFECVHEPRKALEHNVVGTYNVIEAAQAAGVRKVVYSSSASVYGDALFTPITEDHPFNNDTMYGATKIAGEQFLRTFHKQHALDYVGLRYMNAYGPRMDYKGAYVSVIMKVLDKIDAGEPPVIFGDGSQAYDFVHVHDVARANVLALRSDATDASYNVCTGVKTTIKELVDGLLEITGSGVEPEYRPDEPMFVKLRVGSTEAAERHLGFRAEVPIEAGLRSVVEWRRSDQRRAAAPQAG
jgi:UDP-glucose 4-epimerase